MYQLEDDTLKGGIKLGNSIKNYEKKERKRQKEAYEDLRKTVAGKMLEVFTTKMIESNCETTENSYANK